MKWMKRLGTIVLTLSMVIIGGLSVPARGQEAETTPEVRIKIGMVDTLFRDVPRSFAFAMMKPFGSAMKSLTGVSGDFVPGGTHDNLGQMLAENQVQIAVMNGIEFAWVKTQYPELQPLMIAVNRDPHLRALIMVNPNSGIETFADLQGKTLGMPKGTIEHCRVFLRHQCEQQGQEAKDFFGKVTIPGTMEDALDDVIDDQLDAVIVDAVALQCFKERKPGRFKELKVLVESEVFPAGVIVYNPSTLDEATQESFRNGLLNAKNLILGRQLLMMWKLSGFEPVPEDYETTLQEIVTVYLPPAAAAKPAQ